MTRAVTLTLAALLAGTASLMPYAQTPAALPAASSKVLIQTSLSDALAGKVTVTSLPVPRGTTVAAYSLPRSSFPYILEGDIENQVDRASAKLITFTVGVTGKVEEPAKPNSAIKTLIEKPADVANREARLSILSLAPGWWGAGRENVGAHQHPGPIFAYILKGEIESQVDPDPPRVYRAGDVFYEPQMHAHRLFRNTSKTEPAKLLMFQIFDKDGPTAMAVK